MIFSETQKRALPKGTPVINCHIQEGADLSAPMVEKSFSEAEAFFTALFPEVRFRAFLCCSWLLYPPMLERLPDRSRIKQFAKRFRIIGSCDDAEQAMENLFEGRRAIDSLPENASSLQVLAKEHPEAFGFGCGVADFQHSSPDIRQEAGDGLI